MAVSRRKNANLRLKFMDLYSREISLVNWIWQKQSEVMIVMVLVVMAMVMVMTMVMVVLMVNDMAMVVLRGYAMMVVSVS